MIRQASDEHTEKYFYKTEQQREDQKFSGKNRSQIANSFVTMNLTVILGMNAKLKISIPGNISIVISMVF